MLSITNLRKSNHEQKERKHSDNNHVRAGIPRRRIDYIQTNRSYHLVLVAGNAPIHTPRGCGYCTVRYYYCGSKIPQQEMTIKEGDTVVTFWSKTRMTCTKVWEEGSGRNKTIMYEFKLHDPYTQESSQFIINQSHALKLIESGGWIKIPKI